LGRAIADSLGLKPSTESQTHRPVSHTVPPNAIGYIPPSTSGYYLVPATGNSPTHQPTRWNTSTGHLGSISIYGHGAMSLAMAGSSMDFSVGKITVTSNQIG